MNNIILAGIIHIDKENTFSSYGESFYRCSMECKRTSGINDVLNVVIPEIKAGSIECGSKIKIIGEIRTRNVIKDEKGSLDVFVFANEILEYEKEDENFVRGNGFVCKKPTFRETPSGRNISDLILCAHRERTNKSDYIPTIVWGRNAIRAQQLEVGCEVCFRGRLQSREYIKRHDDGSEETKTAYELSVGTFEVSANED